MGEPTATSNVATRDAYPSAFWRGVLDFYLKRAPTPIMRLIRQRVPEVVFEEFVIVGRRTGTLHHLLLGLYDVNGTWYVGHPNGTTQWVLNLEAVGECTVTRRHGIPVRVRAAEVPDGEERDAVIRQTWTQPAPSGQIYRGAASHIRAVGRFFRLEPISAESPSGPAGG